MDALDALAGARLIAVTFVWDYVQFQFEGERWPDVARLNAYTKPEVQVEQRCRTHEDEGWRDSLCARIGRIVKSASGADNRIAVQFEDDTNITVSLRQEDYVGTEAFELTVPGHHPMAS